MHHDSRISEHSDDGLGLSRHNINQSTIWGDHLSDRDKSALIEITFNNKNLSPTERHLNLLGFAESHFAGKASSDVSVHLMQRLAKAHKEASFKSPLSAPFSPEGMEHLRQAVLIPFEKSVASHISRATNKEVSAKDLTYIVWSFATFGYQPETVLDPLINKITKSASQFTTEGLAVTLWSLSRLRSSNAELIRSVGSLVAKKDKDYPPVDLVSLANTFAEWRMPNGEAMNAIVEMSKSKIRAFDTRNLSNLCRALALMDLKRDDLSFLVTKEFHRKAREANPEDLATISWALGKLRYRDEDLFTSIGDQAVSLMAKFSQKQVSNLLYGFAAANIQDKFLFNLGVDRMTGRGQSLSSQCLANTAWSCAIGHPGLVSDLVSRETLEYLTNDIEWMQVYTALLSVGDIDPADVFDRYQAIEKQNPKQPGQFEKDVHAELSRRFKGSSVSICPQKFIAGSHVDFVVKGKSFNTIIECDGFYHKTTGPDGGCMPGKDALQNKLFEICGYDVIHLKSSDYYSNNRGEALERMFNEM
jgi:very-short-patch-repair endonuclease